MSTAERLSRFYDFDSEILASIEDVAAEQNQHTFRELADRYGIAGGPEHPPTKFKPFEVLTLQPAEFGERHARVLHTPYSSVD